MQEIVVALCRRVVVHDVNVCLGIVMIHLVVPRHSVDAAHEASVENRQLPVLAVVDLAGTRQYECQPQCPLGAGPPQGPVASFLPYHAGAVLPYHGSESSLIIRRKDRLFLDVIVL